MLVVVGVSGSGKSTIAALLAARLGWPFQEGDDLQPQANQDKMRAGTPLDDTDRAPWLALVAGWIAARMAVSEDGIITCSALKRAYRQQLAAGQDGVLFVYLQVSRERLEAHLAGRSHAFMPPSLLDSQLATLEEPGVDERAITVPIADTPEATTSAVMRTLGQT